MCQIGECCRQLEEGIGDRFTASVAAFHVLGGGVGVNFGLEVVGR